jgi:hypothetical protein
MLVRALEVIISLIICSDALDECFSKKNKLAGLR